MHVVSEIFSEAGIRHFLSGNTDKYLTWQCSEIKVVIPQDTRGLFVPMIVSDVWTDHYMSNGNWTTPTCNIIGR